MCLALTETQSSERIEEFFRLVTILHKYRLIKLRCHYQGCTFSERDLVLFDPVAHLGPNYPFASTGRHAVMRTVVRHIVCFHSLLRMALLAKIIHIISEIETLIAHLHLLSIFHWLVFLILMLSRGVKMILDFDFAS